MKLKLLILVLAILIKSYNAFASISIYPYGIDFEENSRKRVQSVKIINSSDENQTYRVSVVNFKQTSDGKLIEVEDIDYSAKQYITFSPRQFTLKPREAQTINVARRSIAGAVDGEYISHLKVSEVNLGMPKKNTSANSNTLSMQLKPLFAVTIPVTVEKGKGLQNKTSIVSYKKTSDKNVLITFKREGNKASKFNLTIKDEKGNELSRVNNVKIYKSTETLDFDVKFNNPITNLNAVLILEDVKSKEEIYRQPIKL